MPVLATMAVLALLRDSEDESILFTDARALRRSLRAGLADEEGNVLAEALSIADRIQALMEAYRQRIEKALDTSIAEPKDQYTYAPERIAQLATFDTEREQVLSEIIEARQALHQLLTDEQWNAVFSADS